MKTFVELLEVTKPLINNKVVDLVREIKKKQSPYTYKADALDFDSNYITFSYEDSLSRDKSIKHLKKLGFPEKLMSKSGAPKGSTFPFDLHLDIRNV